MPVSVLYRAGIAAVFVFSFLRPAFAESIGVVAVDKPPGPGSELAELTLQLRAAAADRAQGVLEASALRERMTAQTSSSTLAELDRAYAGALATYQNGDFEGSVRTLRAVVDDLEKLPDSAEAFAQWKRAMLRLARSEQTLGHREVALALLETLVRAAPGLHADATQYPPSFDKQLRAAEAQLRKLPLRKLTVQASAPGVRVFVEGREVGPAPATVSLPAGRYRVSGRLGDISVPRVPVDLARDDQTVTLNFGIAEALRPSWGPGLALPEGNRQGALITAGAFLGLDKLLAASLASQDEVSYLVGAFYDVRRGMLLRQGSVRLSKGVPAPGSVPALASFLLTGQASELMAAGGAVGNQPPPVAPPPAPATAQPAPSTKLSAATPAGRAAPPPSRVPSAALPAAPVRAKPSAEPNKALGWAAVGAGALALGLGGFGAVEGISANNSYGSARNLLAPNSNTLQSGADPARYKGYVSDGDSAKSKAYIATGAAVGLAAVAVVLFVLAQ